MRVMQAVIACLATFSAKAFAQTYVSPNGSNEHPYRTWETGAHLIQDAIDASEGWVFVAPGDYVGNIVLPPGISVWGAGRESCTIVGAPAGAPQGNVAVVMDQDTTLAGFTVDAQGCWTGVKCENAQIRDCAVIGAVCGISALDSVITACTVVASGEGIRPYGGCVVYDCVVSGCPTGLLVTQQDYVLVLHSTVTGNRYGIENYSARPMRVSDSIVWGNSEDDFCGTFNPPDVVRCLTGDARFVGVNGNISADPLFVGWGHFNDSDNPIWVDCSSAAEQDGTSDNPFRTIGGALRAYDFHLSVGSPCIGAASDGLNIGAFPYDVATRERSPSVLINVAPGTYKEASLVLRDGTHVRAIGRGESTIAPPEYHLAFWMQGSSAIEGLVVRPNRATAVLCAPGSCPLISDCTFHPDARDTLTVAISLPVSARPVLSQCIIRGFEYGLAGPPITHSSRPPGGGRHPRWLHGV